MNTFFFFFLDAFGGLDLYFENGLVLGLSFCELCTFSDWGNGNLKKNTVEGKN